MDTNNTLLRKTADFPAPLPLHVRKHRLNGRADGQYAMHCHDFLELELIMEGSGSQVFNRTSQALSCGCAYLIRPTDRHSVFSEPGDPLYLYTVQFFNEALSPEVRKAVEEAHAPIMSSLPQNAYNNLLFLIRQIEDEYASQTVFAREIISKLLDTICMKLLRTVVTADEDTGIPAAIQDAAAHIRRHYRDDINVQMLAKRVGMSRNYFGMLFRKYTGASIGQTINDLRLQYAWDFVTQTDLPIHQIAAESGFGSVTYMINRFHHRYGASPETLRKQLRDAASA